jgi:hypothetical protein
MKTRTLSGVAAGTISSTAMSWNVSKAWGPKAPQARRFTLAGLLR